ncbi:MAG: hypothetical protein RMI35_03895 [Leptospiraceae bacterium]|nr:hypothetical protein [Leptospiraceae bacterium]
MILPLNIIFPQAQQKTTNPGDKITLTENPLIAIHSSDYLERHIASKKFPKVKEDAEKNLRKLNRILKHYEKDIPESQKQYEEALNHYKKAMESFVSNDILEAYKNLLQSRKISNELLQKYGEVYQKRALEISNEVSNKILLKDPKEFLMGSFNYLNSEHNLNVLKDKIHTANYLTRIHQYADAIELYRNAKIIGIITLLRLEEEANRPKILEKFKIDLEDANYKVERTLLETF